MSDYTGQMAFGATATWTETGGGGAVTIDRFLEFTPPVKKATEASYTPIDGAMGGNEQVVAGKNEKSVCSAKLIYSKAYYNELLALYRTNGALALTLADGGVLAGTGCVTEVTLEKLDDTNIESINMVISLSAGWTFTPGA